MILYNKGASRMNKILVVAKKEMKELINNKRTFITGVFFALWFSVFTSLAIKGVDSPAAFLNNLVFYLALTIGVFIGYIFSGQVFLREKREKIIETLLCTPLSLRSIWLGKVMGVTLPAHLVSILTVALVIAISNVLSPSLLFPSATVLFHLLVVVPTFIAFAAGLMGFCQFLLGMRENQIINLLIFVALFGALTLTTKITGFVVSWMTVGVLLIVAVFLLALITYLSKYLSKEKIVTSIS